MAALANASPGGGHSGGAPGRIVAILTAKEAFVKSQSSATPAQLAQFLRTTVENAAEPLVDCPKWTKELMDGHLKKLGWDRKTNAKLDGAVGPPSVEQVKDELVELYESVQMMA